MSLSASLFSNLVAAYRLAGTAVNLHHPRLVMLLEGIVCTKRVRA